MLLLIALLAAPMGMGMSMDGAIGGGGGPVCGVEAWASGVSQLPRDLTINSATVSPAFRFEGQDATTGAWTAVAGPDLTGAGSGGVIDAPAPFTDDSLGANPDDTRHWAAPDTSTGQITTEDVVFEAVVKPGGFGATQFLIGNQVNASGGWEFYVGSGGGIYFRLDPGSNYDLVSTAQAAGAWIHVLVAVNRDENSTNGARVYVNGVDVSSTGTNPAAFAATAASSEVLTVGERADGSLPTDSTIVYAALWLQASWHQAGASGPTEWDAVAAERARLVWGGYNASVAGDPVPAFTRASPATLTKAPNGSDPTVFTVGAGAERIGYSPCGSNGLLLESAATNLCLQSEDLSTTWGYTASTETADTSVSPDGSTTADTLTAAAGTLVHSVFQVITNSPDTYTLSIFAKAGTHDYAGIGFTQAGGTDRRAAAYDLASVAASTVIGAGTATIRAAGNGWYRLTFKTTTVAAATDYYMEVAVAEDASNFLWVGAAGGTESVLFWGAQVEAAPAATSYIATTTGTATRIIDSDLQHDSVTGLPTEGTIAVEVCHQANDFLGGSSVGILEIGSSTAERALIYGVWNPRCYSGNASTSANITDGAAYSPNVTTTYACQFDSTSIRLLKDGAATGTDDTDGGDNPAVTPDTIFVGGTVWGDPPPNAWIHTYSIWDSATEVGP